MCNSLHESTPWTRSQSELGASQTAQLMQGEGGHRQQQQGANPQGDPNATAAGMAFEQGTAGASGGSNALQEGEQESKDEKKFLKGALGAPKLARVRGNRVDALHVQDLLDACLAPTRGTGWVFVKEQTPRVYLFAVKLGDKPQVFAVLHPLLLFPHSTG